jgi:hypothetical protein
MSDKKNSEAKHADPKPRDPRDVLRAIEAIAEDVLDADYPEELVDAELREAGLDPVEVARRGSELAARLLAEQRAALRSEAIAEVAPLAARVEAARARPRRTRQEMLDRIARVKDDPRFAGQIAVAARGRRPDEPTDDELAATCAALEALGILPPDGDP